MYYGVKVRKELVYYSDCIGEKDKCDIVPVEDVDFAFEDGVEAIFKNYEDAEEYQGLIEM